MADGPNLLDKWKWLGAIMADTRLTDAARRVAFVLADADGRRGCFPRFDTISDRAAVPERTAKDAVRRLQEAGYLAHRRGGRNTPNRYELDYRAAERMQRTASYDGETEANNGQPTAPYSGGKDAGTRKIGCKNTQDRVQPTAPYQDQTKPRPSPRRAHAREEVGTCEGVDGGGATDANDPDADTPKTARQTGLGLNDPAEREFEEWWQLVPRKVAKGRARKAYRAARKQADLKTLKAGIQEYARQCREAETPERFVKHPATWLNGECWKDGPSDRGAAPPDDERFEIDGLVLRDPPWRARVGGYARNKTWLDSWGPSPEEPGCQAPPEILREFGFTAGVTGGGA